MLPTLLLSQLNNVSSKIVLLSTTRAEIRVPPLAMTDKMLSLEVLGHLQL